MTIRWQTAGPALWMAAAATTGVLTAATPGQLANTPVKRGNSDTAAYAEWQDGKTAPLAGSRDHQPEWVLWTDGTQPGHSGFTFGKSSNTGVRHLRLGFRNPVTAGSALVLGGGTLAVLRPGAAYPGALDRDADWIPATRLGPDGKPTSAPLTRDQTALWTLPARIPVRALRFTHTAVPTDARREGWLGGVLLLPERWSNIAPLARADASANARHAGKIINGRNDGWGAWENRPFVKNDAAAPVSEQNPVFLTLIWNRPVTLDGLAGIATAFGAMTVERYDGPDDRHPRSARDGDWKTVQSFRNFEVGYPAPLWPNVWKFAKPVTTRAIRLRITGVSPMKHPHVANKDNGGRRVWLGEIFACRTAPDANAPDASDLTAAAAATAHAPIPVPFKIDKPGFVTLVIEDPAGNRIRNLVSETPFPAGDNIAWWDGTDDLGRDVDAARHGLYRIPAQPVRPGSYTARGLWHRGVRPYYEFSIYAPGNPPWNTPDHTGAWLANHSAPSAAAFVPAARSPFGEPAVYLGSYITEGPDGLAWVDESGRKRGGVKWIGGNWSAAPYLAADAGPQADPSTTVYVGAMWEPDNRRNGGSDTLS